MQKEKHNAWHAPLFYIQSLDKDVNILLQHEIHKAHQEIS
jgi:hypothetical protein